MKSPLPTLMALLAASLISCTTVQTTDSGAIGVDRKQMMLVSEAQVEASAGEAYAQELSKATKGGSLNVDAQQLKRVRTIADRIIAQTPVFRPDAKNWQWQINVQKTDELNAYCMPGGKIMVYSGIIDKLKLTDAELAAIIGHEVAHALREHTRERVSRSYAQQVGLGVLASLTGLGDAGMQLAGQITQVTFSLPHSREQESEADLIGLELMARAGYDPNEAVTLWQKMQQQAGNSGPEFMSTHPSSGNRINELRGNIPKVMPLYLATKKPGQ